MQFLLLIYHNEKHWMSLPKEVRSGVYQDYRAFADNIVKNGSYREGGELEPSSSGFIVRVNENKIVVSEGPFDQTKQQVAGFFLIETNVVDDAIAIAAQIPGARDGAVEVRAVRIG